MAESGTRTVRRVVNKMQRDAGSDPIGDVLIGRGDRRAFTGDSALEPLDRMARYLPDDAAEGEGRFREVRAGELADVPRVYVFAHGWVPGSRETTEGLYVEDGRVALAWDERVANKLGRTLVEAYEPLLAALSQRDPDAAVLWYSWVDQSGTDTEIFAARNSLGLASVNGRRLAAALTALIGDGDPGLHLIGHSHGSVVATYAALSVQQPVAHLTLLDCPEDWFSRSGGAAGLLPDILPRLLPGRGPQATFVDSYASMFGRAYHDDPGCDDVVDVRLTPAVRRSDQASAVSQAHHYPVIWYAGTVCDPDAAGGSAWSPLHGFDTEPLGAQYIATSSGRLAEVLRRGHARGGEPEQVITPLGRGLQELTRRSPDVAYFVRLPHDTTLVEFDLDFTRPGKDTRIDIAVDGHLACSIYATAPVPAQGRFVHVSPGPATLQFRLIAGGLRSTASVGGLRVVRGPSKIRNLDDTAAMARVAALGAITGAAGVLALLISAAGARSLVRRLRPKAVQLD